MSQKTRRTVWVSFQNRRKINLSHLRNPRRRPPNHPRSNLPRKMTPCNLPWRKSLQKTKRTKQLKKRTKKKGPKETMKSKLRKWEKKRRNSMTKMRRRVPRRRSNSKKKLLISKRVPPSQNNKKLSKTRRAIRRNGKWSNSMVRELTRRLSWKRLRVPRIRFGRPCRSWKLRATTKMRTKTNRRAINTRWSKARNSQMTWIP